MQVFLFLCMLPFIAYIFRKANKGLRCKGKTTGTLHYDEKRRENAVFYEVAGEEYVRYAGNTYNRRRNRSISVVYNPLLPAESFIGKLDRAAVYFSLTLLLLFALPLIVIRLALKQNIEYSTVLITVESLGGIVLILASFGLLLMLFESIAKLLTYSETVSGTVASIESYRQAQTTKSGRQRNETFFYPVVQYKVDGVVYAIKADMATNFRIFRLQEQVPVIHRASYPEDAMIKDRKYIIPLLASLLLGCLAAFSFGVFLLYILWQQVLVYLI